MALYARKVTYTYTTIEFFKAPEKQNLAYLHRDAKKFTSVDLDKPAMTVIEDFRRCTPIEEALVGAQLKLEEGGE